MDAEIKQILLEMRQIATEMKVTLQRIEEKYQEYKQCETKMEESEEDVFSESSIVAEETKREVSIEDESQELKKVEIESEDISESASDGQKTEVVVDTDFSCDRPWLNQPIAVVAPADSSHPSRLILGLLQEHSIPGMYPLDDLYKLLFHFSPLSCVIFFPHKTLKNGGEASTLHLLPYLHFLPYNQTSAINLINYSKTQIIFLLIDIHPEKWSLISFEYWIEGTLFVEASVTLSTLSNFSFSLCSFTSDQPSFSLLQFLFCSRLCFHANFQSFSYGAQISSLLSMNVVVCDRAAMVRKCNYTIAMWSDPSAYISVAFDKEGVLGAYNVFNEMIQRASQYVFLLLEMCHRHGVMHRDLKPENFLFANKKENSALKAIDFGLSVTFKPGEKFTEILGSPYYMAPEVLKCHYGPEIDVWSAGVILYILLCGVPSLWAETEQEVAPAIIRSVVNFKRDPWPKVSANAKDLVRKILDPDPKKRLTAQKVLDHPWLQNIKKTPNVSLGETMKARLKQFSVMHKLKKKALKVIAEQLSMEEVTGIKEAFVGMDIGKVGKINLELLRVGLQKRGHHIPDTNLQILIEAADVDGDGTLSYAEFVAVYLLYIGAEAGPPNLHSQKDNSFAPNNNLEEATLLLMLLFGKRKLNAALYYSENLLKLESGANIKERLLTARILSAQMLC